VITAQLESDTEASTKDTVTSDLTITGKVAQFGRGALADVSDKLLKQFVHNLETTVLNEPIGGAEPAIAETSDAAATTSAETASPGADTGPGADATTPGADAGTGPSTSGAAAAYASAAATATSAATPTLTPKIRTIEGKPVEPINLLETAGGTMLKRLVPLGLLAIVVFVLFRRRRS
jgi:hypothetical protein